MTKKHRMKMYATAILWLFYILFFPSQALSADYGERSTFFENDTERDENGKPIVFNTVVDALNYIKK